MEDRFYIITSEKYEGDKVYGMEQSLILEKLNALPEGHAVVHFSERTVQDQYGARTMYNFGMIIDRRPPTYRDPLGDEF